MFDRENYHAPLVRQLTVPNDFVRIGERNNIQFLKREDSTHCMLFSNHSRLDIWRKKLRVTVQRVHEAGGERAAHTPVTGFEKLAAGPEANTNINSNGGLTALVD